jgi:hypothetical protein
MDSTNIENSLRKLLLNFEGIQTIIKEIELSKQILSDKNTEFKTMYTELIKTNNKTIFIFCLDSLFFQYKSCMMDLDAFEMNRKFIMNRMYCDYYKLYHLIISELNEKCILTIETKTYPQYKNLEILHEYNLHTIINIHSDILEILYKLYEKIKQNCDALQKHIETKSLLYVSNFLNTLKYESQILNYQIMLYINYLSFFHFSQNKMLVKLYSKMSGFNSDMDEYMGFNRIISIDDIHSIYSESGRGEENLRYESDSSKSESSETSDSENTMLDNLIHLKTDNIILTKIDNKIKDVYNNEDKNLVNDIIKTYFNEKLNNKFGNF